MTFSTFDTTTDMFHWQEAAVNHVMPTRVGGLLMDMGLGKTRAAFELMKRRQGKYTHVVWFTLVNLKETTRHELSKHTTIPESSIYTFDDKTRANNLPSTFLYIVGLESMGASDRVVTAALPLLTETAFVIVDESSAIKGHTAKRTRRLIHMCANTMYRLILTGTPISQGIVDLYTQMRFLSPKILGYNSFYSFAANHLEYHPDYKDMIVRSHNTEYIAAKIAPYVYQCTKDEVADLPRKIYDSRHFSLTAQQQEAYMMAKEEILGSADLGEIDIYTLFRLFNSLRQIASGFWIRRRKAGAQGRLIELASDRAEQMLDVIAAIPSHERIIVWTEYTYSTQLCAREIGAHYGASAVHLHHGGMPLAEKSAAIDGWKRNGRILVATTQTGGRGLNLDEGSYNIFYEHQFKYDHRIQAEDRTLRLTTKRSPTYISLVSNAAIDTRMIDALSRKENAVEAFRKKLTAANGNRAQIAKMIEEL